MKSPALSPRMMAVAALIPDDGVVADIGADHGRLSVWLASRGRRVIAVDISARSLAKAAALASRCGVAERVACGGDGLEPLEPARQTAVLAVWAAGRWRRYCRPILSKPGRCIWYCSR